MTPVFVNYTLFGLLAVVAIGSAVGMLFSRNAVHSALFLVLNFATVAFFFLFLGAPFIAMVQVTVYAGAIMVLFVFVVMMLSLGTQVDAQEHKWLQLRVWVGPSIFATALLAEMAWLFSEPSRAMLGHTLVDGKQVGIALYGPYLLTVELASMLLLAALVAAWHLGKHDAREDRQAVRVSERLSAESHVKLDKAEGGLK